MHVADVFDSINEKHDVVEDIHVGCAGSMSELDIMGDAVLFFPLSRYRIWIIMHENNQITGDRFMKKIISAILAVLFVLFCVPAAGAAAGASFSSWSESYLSDAEQTAPYIV